MPRHRCQPTSLALLGAVLGLICGLLVTVGSSIDRSVSALCADVEDGIDGNEVCFTCEATAVSADGLTVNFQRTDNVAEPAIITVNGVPASTHRFEYNERRFAWIVPPDGTFRNGNQCGLPAIPGPFVRCVIDRQLGPGGSDLGFSFVPSIDADSGGYLQEWTFPDGTTSTANSVAKTAALPGQYLATIRLYRSDGSLDISNTCTANVEAPTVSMSIRAKHDDPANTESALTVGEEFDFVISLSASGGIGDVSNIFTTAIADANPEFIVTGSYRPPFPARVTLTSNAPAQEYRLRAKATRAGSFSVTVRAFEILDAAGNPVPEAEQVRNFRVVGNDIDVKIVADPDDFELQDGDDGPIPKTISVDVEVTNTSGSEIEMVEGDATLITGVIVGEEKLIRQTSGPTVDPVAGIDETKIGPLAPDETKKLSYEFEVSGNGLYSIDALIRYTVTAGGANGRKAVSTQIRAGFPASIEANLRFIGNDKANTTIQSGGLTSAFLDLKNTSNTATIEIDKTRLRIKGSAGGGFLAPTEDTVPSAYVSGQVPVPRNVLIGPGETVTFDAWLYGAPNIIGRGNAFISFEPTGTVTDRSVAPGVAEERPLVRGDLEFKDGRDELKLGILEPPPTYGEQSWAAIGRSLTKGFLATSTIWLSNTFTGFVDIADAVASGRFGLAVGDAFAHMSELFVAYYYMSDADRDAFITLVAVQIADAEDSAFEAARVAIEAEFDRASKAYFDGNYTELAEITGSGTATIFWEVGMLEAGAGGLVVAAQKARFADRIIKLTAKGLGKVKNGAIISRRASIAFGYTRRVVDDVSLLAKRERLNITVKPRDPDALVAIGQRQARVKPEFIKPKTVSQIDIDILGFPKKSKATVSLRPGLKSEIPDLTALRKRFDDAGYDPDLFPAVQKRYEKRLDELDEYLPELRELDGTDVSTEFNTAENGFPDGLNPDDPFGDAPQVLRKERFDLVEKDGVIELRIDDKPVTSDMDVLSITQSNGKPLTKEQRIRVYRQLEEIADIQHPESATWLEDGGGATFGRKLKVFEEFSSDQVGNAPALQFGGDGKLHAVRYNKNSKFISADQYFLHWDGGFRADGNIEFPISGSTSGFTSLELSAAATGTVLAGGFSARNSNGESVPTVQTTSAEGRPLTITNGTVQEYVPGPTGANARLVSAAAPLERIGAQAAAPLGRIGGQWVDAGPASFDGLARIAVLPQTLVTVAGNTGDVGLTTFSRSQLSTVTSTGEQLLAIEGFFEVGQTVVVDPGGPNEETAVLAGVTPFTFAAPLTRDHVAGELVMVIRPLQVDPTPTTQPPATQPPATQAPTPTTIPMGELPATGGGESGPTLVWLGLLLIAIGTILVRIRRRPQARVH